MSTTINVTVGGNGLLDQSRQQMQANRFGRLERDQDSQAEAQATQQQQTQRQRDELLGRPAQLRRRDPEPAAYRFRALQLGHLWLFEKYLNETTTRTCVTLLSGFSSPSERISTQVRTGPFFEKLLVCGDGSQSVTVRSAEVSPPAPEDYFGGIQTTELPIGPSLWAERAAHSLPQFTLGSQEFVFPSGAESMIYAVVSNAGVAGYRVIGIIRGVDEDGNPATADSYAQARQHPTDGYSLVSYTTYQVATRKVQVFSCSNRHVREVDCPQRLADFIDYMYPPLTLTEETRYWLFDSLVYQYYVSPGPAGPSPTDPDEFQNGLQWTSGHTPAFFDRMNQIQPFPAGFTIKQCPPTIKGVIEDTSKGGWSAFADPDSVNWPYFSPLYNGGQPLFYGQYPQETQIVVPAKRPSVKPAATRVPIPPFVDGEGTERFFVSMDWNDPNYCYEACKAMGFSDADLRP